MSKKTDKIIKQELDVLKRTVNGLQLSYTSSCSQIESLTKANDEMVDAIKEARDHLGWLNTKHVMASSNVVLKRLDGVIKKYVH